MDTFELNKIAGAVLGTVAGFVFFTESGRAWRRQLEPALDELRRRGAIGPYDRGYQEFDRQSHPRYSPIGGTYPAMGGRYAYHRPPRPLREDTWFSDWTRWF